MKPSGDAANSCAASRRGSVDRVGVEVHPVARHQMSPAHELANLGAVDVVGLRRRESARSRHLEIGVVDERIDHVRRAHGGGVDDHVGERGEHRPLPVVERRQVDAERATGADALQQHGPHRVEFVGGGQPVAHRRFDTLPGQPLELGDRHPAALANDPFDRPVGRCPRRTQYRRDVEHLATADGLVAPRLAQHEAVAGQQRQRGREEQADRAVGARRDRLGAEHAQPHGVLARADVGDEGAASRHLVVEGGEHVDGGVEPIA